MSVVNFEEIRDVYLTQANLTSLIEEAEKAFAESSNSLFISVTYGVCNKNKRIQDELFLYLEVLKRWVQYSDGTTYNQVNTITRKQFSAIVNRLKFILRG